MPAILKAFFENVLRPGFAFGKPVEGAETARAAWLAKMAVLGRKAG